MPVKFYQYSDQIEIMNPGGLYDNECPENFGNVTDDRNPVIAGAMEVPGDVNRFCFLFQLSGLEGES
jgi:ATP-dependent DNA helicase RecG